jgi:uncharacterized protein (DUF58 family)
VRSTVAAVGLGAALCLAGASFAVPSLYLPGAALVLIAAAAGAWVRLAARGVRVTRSLGAVAVEEQAALPVTVRVSHGRTRLPCADVQGWPGAETAPLRKDGTITASARFARRGRHVLGPASVLISDPLALSRRAVASGTDEVLVLPRIESVRAVEMGGEAGIFGSRTIHTSDSGATEVDSLRPYRPGTSASRIHWPTVARTAILMERRLVSDGDHRPLIVVDPRRASSTDALDEAIRAAASLCVHLARRGGCALLLPGDRRPTRIDTELYGFSELHARLALLDVDAGAPPLGRVTGAQVVLWVTASATPAATFVQLRAPARYLVSPHALPGSRVLFTVAGCGAQLLERDARARAA